MPKPKICLIYTGGTIGMTRTANGVLVPPENPASFLKIAPEIKKIADFDFIPLMNKDSTNVTPKDWRTIAEKIYQESNKGYAGFVIAHGTDTMHFTSTAVALALGNNLNFPVVFTGSQTAPDIIHGDSKTNLIRAFKVALSDIAETVICFDTDVLRACRSQKVSEYSFKAFASPAFEALAEISQEILTSPKAKKRTEMHKLIDLRNDFLNSGITTLAIMPGLNPKTLSSLLGSPTCKGLVLQSLGAGNVPNEGDYSLIEGIRAARKHNKPIMIASQFPANSAMRSDYEPGKAAIEAGAIPVGNMTAACTYVKLSWIMGQPENVRLTPERKLERVRAMMNTPYIGEIDV